MYQTKQVHYKSIFKQDGQTETIEYKERGVFHTGEQTHLSFTTSDGTIDIRYDKDGIILQHGKSQLRFRFEKEMWNQYQLPYGMVALKTKLLKFEANDSCIKIKYELYDQSGLISTAYIYITMMPYNFSEELSDSMDS